MAQNLIIKTWSENNLGAFHRKHVVRKKISRDWYLHDNHPCNHVDAAKKTSQLEVALLHGNFIEKLDKIIQYHITKSSWIYI